MAEPYQIDPLLLKRLQEKAKQGTLSAGVKEAALNLLRSVQTTTPTKTTTKPMNFPLYEGLTPEQKQKAELVINTPSTRKVTATDVLKEVPGAAVKVGKGTATLAKEVLQGTARGIGSVPVTLLSPITKKEVQTVEDLDKYPALQKVRKIIYGDEPVKSIQTRISESEIDIQRSKIAQSPIGQSIGLSGKSALPLSLIGVPLLTALDFTGFGGKEGTIKVLSKLNEADKVSDIMRGMGIAEDLITEYAPLIAKTKKTEEITKMIDRIAEIQKTTKAIKTTIPQIQKYNGRAYRAESNLLVRGKNAQEIVDFEAVELGNIDIKKQAESLGIDLTKIPEKDVVWVAKNRNIAERYGDEVDEVILPKDATILATDGEDGYLVYRGSRPISDFYKSSTGTAQKLSTGAELTEELAGGTVKATPKAFQFYSPNIDEGLTFDDAVKRLSSPEQAKLKAIADDIDVQLGLKSSQYDAIGDWSDGAENTIYNEISNATNWETVRYSSALKGRYAEQKSVIPFLSATDGADSVYRMEITGKDIQQIRKDLDTLGLKYRTLVQDGNKTKVVVFDQGTALRNNINDFASKYETEFQQINGKGEFLGAETREEARGIYDNVISEYEKGLGNKRYRASSTGGESVSNLRTAAKVDEATFVKESEELAASSKNSFNWTERSFIENVRRNQPDIPLYVAGKYVPRSTDRLAIKARTLIQDDIVLAEKIATTGTNDTSVAVAAELIKHYSDEAEKVASTAAKNVLYAKAADVAHITARNLTDAGRAVQAASIMGRLTPEGVLRFAAREINKYNEAVDVAKASKYQKYFRPTKKIPNLSPEQAKDFLASAKKIAEMEDGIDKAKAAKQLFEQIGKLIPTPLWKKLISIWKAGLLTGIKTSGLNTMSNTWHGVSEMTKDVVATPLDMAISLITGKRTTAFTFKGLPQGVKQGFKKGWDYLKTGFDERNMDLKLDLKRVNMGNSKFAKAIQGYEETIFRLMGAEDQPFYYGAKIHSLYNQAIAIGKNAGKKGSELKAYVQKLLDAPTDEMLKYAQVDAEIAVFQNETLLGKIARQVQRIPGGEVIVPFGRTPASVATQFLNYSPVGIVSTILKNIGKGKFDQRLFVQGMARGLTGTGIMFLGAELAKKKLITLSYPKTEREQKLWELEGRQPNSIKVGNKWRNLNTLGPAGNVLQAGAWYQNGLEETGSRAKALLRAVVGGTASLKEQTFLQGINSFVTALDDPQKYTTSYFSNTIASIIPTIVGDTARATDPYQRKNFGVLDTLAARIPGLRRTLEPQINVLGEERKRAGNFFETMFDPSRPSTIQSPELVKEFRRLYDLGYKVSPLQLGTKLGYKGLRPEENTFLWERAGQLINTKLSALIKSWEYQKLPEDEKAALLQRFIEKANVIARAEAVASITDGLGGQELKNKLVELKANGILTREVFRAFVELTQ